MIDKIAAEEITKALGSKIDEVVEKRMSKSEIAKSIMSGDSSKNTEVQKSLKDEFVGSYLRKGEVTKAIGDYFNEGSSEAGGATLPKNMADAIVDLLKQDSPIINYARVETISKGNSLEVVVEGSTAFDSGWIAETGDRVQTQEGNFRLVQIPVNEIYANPATTRALVMDSAYDLEGYITRKVAERMGLVLGNSFVKGNGTTKPLGILDPTAGLQTWNAGSQVKTTVSATAITYQELVDLVYSLKTGYAKKGKFFINRKVKGYLQGLTDLNGQPLLRESAIVGEPATMLGYPVVEVEDMDNSVAASKYTVLFGDMENAYRIVLHTDAGILRDDITKKGFVQYYTWMRVGGKLVNPEALVVLQQKA